MNIYIDELLEFVNNRPLGSRSKLTDGLSLVIALEVKKVDGIASKEIVVNLEANHKDKFLGIMDTTPVKKIREQPHQYKDYIAKILTSPITILNSIIVSCGMPINGIYRMNDYKSVYRTIKLDDLKYAIVVNKEVNGFAREQLLIVNINKNKNGRTTVTGTTKLLSLNMISRAFKFGKEVTRTDKISALQDFTDSCKLLFTRWANAHIESIARENAPLAIKITNTKDIDNRYATQINTLLVEYLIDKYGATKMDKYPLSKVILSQVMYDNDFIDSLELYSLNQDEMVLAIKLTNTFLSNYQYSGPTIFKLKTKINIFSHDFILSKEINSELVNVIDKEVEEIVTDFKNHMVAIK